MRQRNHAPRGEEIAKMKLQAFRPSNPKSLQSQTSLRSKNRLPLNGLEGVHGRLTQRTSLVSNSAVTIFRMLRSLRCGSLVTYAQLQRSRPLSRTDQTTVLPRLAPLTGCPKSNRVASEDALNCAHSHDPVSCRSLRGIWTF